MGFPWKNRNATNCVQVVINVNAHVRSPFSLARMKWWYLLARRTVATRKAKAEIPPDTKNRPTNGRGPKLELDPSLTPADCEHELLEVSKYSSNRGISPFSITFRIDCENSNAKREPFGNT